MASLISGTKPVGGWDLGMIKWWKDTLTHSLAQPFIITKDGYFSLFWKSFRVLLHLQRLLPAKNIWGSPVVPSLEQPILCCDNCLLLWQHGVGPCVLCGDIQVGLLSSFWSLFGPSLGFRVIRTEGPLDLASQLWKRGGQGIWCQWDSTWSTGSWRQSAPPWSLSRRTGSSPSSTSWSTHVAPPWYFSRK